MFKGKKIYITGGSSGIGLALGKRFAKVGADIVLFARDEKKLDAALNELEKIKMDAEQRIKRFSVDVSDIENLKSIIPNALKELGPPDILINSAGVGRTDKFENESYEDFDKTIKINLFGTRNMIAICLPLMKGKNGHIVNVSSMIGLIGLYGFTSYAASKFGLIGFSEALRMELKPENINVAVCCPPQVDTPMTTYIRQTSSVETKKLVRMNGLITADAVAKSIINGIKRKKFLIIPGILAKGSYHNNRLFPGITRFVMDQLIKLPF